MRTLPAFILIAALLAAALGAGAQTSTPKELTDSERALVEGSREAIIKTGLSPSFFDAHFRVARVVDGQGDRRVVWLLSIDGYEATVNDSVGFYTEGARRLDTHSVAATLSQTKDIERTITRRRAGALMRRCIGRFGDPRVEYRAHVEGGRASLLLTAHSLVPRRLARREVKEPEGHARPGGTRGLDEVEAGDEGGEGPVVVLGAVDLVTGRCTVGYGQAGPLPPEPARPHRQQR